MFSACVDSVENGVLTEPCIMRASRQYDIELLYGVSLRSLGISTLADGFTRCHALSRLDIAQNRLVNLEGIQLLAGSLTYINAAENKLESVAGIDRCDLLEDVLLEGNQLGSEKAIAPLAGLPRLRWLFFQREIPLCSSTNDTLVLNNPICNNEEAYGCVIQRLFAHVFCVDGHCFRTMTPDRISVTATAPSADLPSSDGLLKRAVNHEDCPEEQIFANAIAECRVACRKAVS